MNQFHYIVIPSHPLQSYLPHQNLLNDLYKIFSFSSINFNQKIYNQKRYLDDFHASDTVIHYLSLRNHVWVELDGLHLFPRLFQTSFHHGLIPLICLYQIIFMVQIHNPNQPESIYHQFKFCLVNLSHCMLPILKHIQQNKNHRILLFFCLIPLLNLQLIHIN